MRNQIQMIHFLTENIATHEFQSKGNKTYGRKLIGSRSFKNFTLTFFKSGEVSLSGSGFNTLRYNNENKLIAGLGSMVSFNGNVYENAQYQLEKEQLVNTFSPNKKYVFLYNGETEKTFKTLEELNIYHNSMIEVANKENRRVFVFEE